MKKLNIIILIICCITASAQEQKPKTRKEKRKENCFAKKNKNVKYDFIKDDIANNGRDWIYQNGKISLDIKNINLFLYDVKINQEKQSYNDDETSITKDYKFNTNNFDEKYLGQNISKITFQLHDLSENLLFYKYEKEYVNESLNFKNFSLFDSIYEKPQINNPDANSKQDLIIIDRIKTLVNKYPDKLKSIIKYKNHILNSQSDIEKAFSYYKSLLSIIYCDGKTLEELLNDRKTLSETIYPKAKEDFVSYIITELNTSQNQIKNNINTIKEDIKFLGGILNNLKYDLDQISNKNEKNKLNALLDINNSIENIKSIESELTDLKEKINNGMVNKLITNISSVYNSFNSNNFNVHFKLFDLDDYDKVFVNVSIKPKSELSLAKPVRTEDFTVVTNTYGGIRFDVSTGLCFNIGLNDKKYHYDSLSHTKKDTVLILENSNKDSYFPFVSSQLNVYWKPFPFNLGTGLCLGLSTNLSKVRYYFGGSFIFGKEEKLVLSGGIAGGEIKTLAEELETGVYYPKRYMATEPKTTEYFKLGYFVSLTYNLRGKKTKAFGETLTK